MDISIATNGVSRRGFASMDPERQREIASQGGSAVPSEKRSFSRNSDLAREAGRRGGANSAKAKKAAAMNKSQSGALREAIGRARNRAQDVERQLEGRR